MKYSTIQHENIDKGHAATIIATNVQNGVPFHGHKPGNVSIRKSFKVVPVCPFGANSFVDLLAQNLQTYTHFKN